MPSAPSAPWRRRNVLRLLLSVLPVLSGCLTVAGARPVAAWHAGRTTLHTLTVHGRTRSYLLSLPAPSGPVPLVLAFHGHHGSAGLLQYASELDVQAHRRGWAVAYLNGTGPLRLAGLTWNVATCCGGALADRVDDIGFVHALVDTLTHLGVIDPARVYATGFSAGGMLALRLACEPRPVVRAVADIAGAMPDTSCPARHRLPVLLVRGDRDRELDADHAAQRRHNSHRFATSYRGAQQFWAHHNGCGDALIADSTALATVLTSAACPPGGAVVQVVLHGVAHEWPGGRSLNRLWPHRRTAADASALLLDFFANTQTIPRP